MGVDCAPFSLRPICSQLVDLSAPDSGGCCLFYVLTPAGARGSRGQISGLLCAKEGLGWAAEWAWRPLWPHPASFPLLGEEWTKVQPSTAPLALGPQEWVTSSGLPW